MNEAHEGSEHGWRRTAGSPQATRGDIRRSGAGSGQHRDDSRVPPKVAFVRLGRVADYPKVKPARDPGATSPETSRVLGSINVTISSGKGSRGGLRATASYALLVGGGVALFLWVRSAGSTLSSVADTAGRVTEKGAGTRIDTLPHVLLALLVILGVSRFVGSLFQRIRQPAVIGEVVAGIALGPSLLGRIWPHAGSFLFPSEVAPFLGVIAQVGVILFMFLVGLELDTSLLKRRTYSSVAISHASILAPFLLGSTASLWIYSGYSMPRVSFTVFSLFLGVALSVTAFPVLARILTDKGIHRSRLGVLALTCAAVGDATAWCLLALLLGVARAQAERSLITVGLTVLFVATVMLLRPLLLRFVRLQESRGVLSQSGVAVIFTLLLVSALATEWIGIHALFGAFLLGAIIPHESLAAVQLREKLEDTVVVLFLPVYFAFTGLRTQIGLVQGVQQWMVCGLIILIAFIGKFGGSYAAARLTKLDNNTAACIGVLMNTRGLMELIVLNLGLDLGILSPTLFAMFVIMALVTTMATSPILDYLYRPEQRASVVSRHAGASLTRM
jgi:Kef-type K+ transport system membrane component KefB